MPIMAASVARDQTPTPTNKSKKQINRLLLPFSPTTRMPIALAMPRLAENASRWSLARCQLDLLSFGRFY